MIDQKHYYNRLVEDVIEFIIFVQTLITNEVNLKEHPKMSKIL